MPWPQLMPWTSLLPPEKATSQCLSNLRGLSETVRAVTVPVCQFVYQCILCARERVSLTGLPNTVQAAKVLAEEVLAEEEVEVLEAGAEVLEAEMVEMAEVAEMVAAVAEMVAAVAEVAEVVAAVAVARKETCRWRLRPQRFYFDDRTKTKYKGIHRWNLHIPTDIRNFSINLYRVEWVPVALMGN